MASLAPSAGWAENGVAGPVRDGWIAGFGSADLNRLVAEALEKNPDLEAASAALEQAIAIARQAGAALYPTVGLSAGGQQTNSFARTDEQRPLGLSSQNAAVGASLDLSWEIDVWGKFASQKRGAVLAAKASASDYAGARQSLAGQVAKSWFLAIELKSQVALAREFADNYTEMVRVVQARLNAGEVFEQDLDQIQAELAATKQQEYAAETSYRVSVRALEVLLGRYPADRLAVPGLQTVPPPVPSGLPSQLLERRPDVVSARLQVASAFQYTKSAAAARLPQIDLTAGVGTSSHALNSLLDPESAAANFGLNLFQPLFDGGLLKAKFEQAAGAQKQAVAQYKGAALAAFQSVENALDSEASLRRQEEQAQTAATSLEKARVIAQVRYRYGETDLTSVLDIERQEIQAKQNLLVVHENRLAERVDLHLALGGNFTPGPIDLSPAPPTGALPPRTSLPQP